MSFWDFITGNASQLVEAVGNAIDKLSTTDEEKLQLKNALEKEVNNFKLGVIKAQNEYERQLTERQKNDMTSDSWLSKNIRPLLLLILTVATLILAYSTIFILSVEEVEKVKAWIPLLTTLLTTGYMFYFGSRGFEKITKIKNNKGE
jgi:hypothetical protein